MNVKNQVLHSCYVCMVGCRINIEAERAVHNVEVVRASLQTALQTPHERVSLRSLMDKHLIVDKIPVTQLSLASPVRCLVGEKIQRTAGILLLLLLPLLVQKQRRCWSPPRHRSFCPRVGHAWRSRTVSWPPNVTHGTTHSSGSFGCQAWYGMVEVVP